MTVTVRFAPSPTGRLHVGNARTALVNWLFARRNNGRFLLRLDDTDTERSSDEFADQIRADLLWLGLVWDDEARQSDRLDRYAEAAAHLRATGRLYPCYETSEELALKRKSLLSRGRPPIYDRAALVLSESERAALEAQGRQPHWRFKLSASSIAWEDLVRGPIHYQGGDLSDPVLIRADGRPLYTLSSVVDDIDFGISQILRGEDHLTNTAVQTQLFEALSAAIPRFGHLSLLTDAAGEGLSKRLGSLSLADLRDNSGLEPSTITSYLAKLGTADPIEPRHHLSDLVADFDIARFSRATPRFDPADLERLNARLLHSMPYDLAVPRLQTLGLTQIDPETWQRLRPNLTRFADIHDWWRILAEPLTPIITDPDLTTAAADLLPPEPWDESTCQPWLDQLKASTGQKGKPLFLALRRALTGRDHGPDLKTLLPLLGHARADARLRGRTA